MMWGRPDGTRWLGGQYGWLFWKPVGGPFDGRKYKWGCIGPEGRVPVRVTVPLGQPGHLGPKASYVRVGDELTEAGTGITYWEFLFEGYVGPDNRTALSDATASSRSCSTCPPSPRPNEAVHEPLAGSEAPMSQGARSRPGS